MKGDDGILVRSTRDPLAGRSADEFLELLVTALRGRVDQAWIFGSFGTPEFGSESDIDLILVVDTDKPFLERARDYFDIMDLALAMDLLVYTQEEFKRLTTNPSAGFWSSVASSMRRML